MPAERYFIESLTTKSDRIAIEGQEFHHVIRVMRTRIGETVEFVNGQGLLAIGVLESIEKERAYFSIDKVNFEPVPKRELILVQALPKVNRLEFIAEKGTELGMTALWLFPGDLSEKKELSANQETRLQAMLIAAMKQCGRLYVPTYSMKPSLKTWKEFPQTAFFGDVKQGVPSFASVLKQGCPNSLVFFVGPESGFSDQEVAILQKNGVRGVHLHDNILRTDTAGIVALTLASTCD